MPRRMSEIDYRTVKVDGVAQDGGDIAAPDNRWWLLEPDEAASSVTSILETLREHDNARMKAYRASAALWGNSLLFGAGGATGTSTVLTDFGASACGFNIVQSVGSTVASKIAKNKPRAMYVSTGGNYEQKRRAKRRNLFADGVCHEVEAHEKEVRAFIVAYVLGDGFLHFHEQNGRVAWTPVMPYELHIDELEARRGNPRQIHWKRNVDRGMLMAAYPEKKDVLAEAKLDPDSEPTFSHIADLVTVRESWHLPSKPGADDGRHMVSVDGHSLVWEPWEDDCFPFERMRWEPRLEGWWSQGGAEQIRGIQIEVQKMALVIQKSLHLFGVPKVFLENGSKIPTQHLNNDIGIVLRGEKPPVYMAPPVLPKEIYTYYESKKSEGFAQLGLSQLSAASIKPAGLNSGEAQRVYNDIESDRFMLLGQEYERFHLACVRQSIALVRRIVKRAGSSKYTVKVPGGDARLMEWEDLDENSAVLQAFPVSSLPNEPAGRMQTVNEWAAKGWINQRTARRLMDMPDLESAESLATASERAIEKVLDGIVDKGDYTPPDPLDDLNLTYEMALETYQDGKCNGLKNDRLDMLRDFLDSTKKLQEEAVVEAMNKQQKQAQMLAAQNGQPPPAPDAAGGAPAQPQTPQTMPGDGMMQ